jgi:hypothetical protein
MSRVARDPSTHRDDAHDHTCRAKSFGGRIVVVNTADNTTTVSAAQGAAKGRCEEAND